MGGTNGCETCTGDKNRSFFGRSKYKQGGVGISSKIMTIGVGVGMMWVLLFCCFVGIHLEFRNNAAWSLLEWSVCVCVSAKMKFGGLSNKLGSKTEPIFHP